MTSALLPVLLDPEEVALDQRPVAGRDALVGTAREGVSDLSVRGGFPQLVLAPVNFDALYLRHQQEQTTA